MQKVNQGLLHERSVQKKGLGLRAAFPCRLLSRLICLKKKRSYPHLAGQILHAFRLAGHLTIEIVSVEHLGVVQMAHETGLPIYDASYLWLVFSSTASWLPWIRSCWRRPETQSDRLDVEEIYTFSVQFFAMAFVPEKC